MVGGAAVGGLDAMLPRAELSCSTAPFDLQPGSADPERGRGVAVRIIEALVAELVRHLMVESPPTSRSVRHPGREMLPQGENDLHLWWLFGTSADVEDSSRGCDNEAADLTHRAPIHEPASQEFRNVVHLCHGGSRPSRCHPRRYTFLYEKGRELVAEAMSFALDPNARVVAVRPACRPRAARAVPLPYPPGREFLQAFSGCPFVGAMAVPAACRTLRAARGEPNPPGEAVERDGADISSASSAFAGCVDARAGRFSSSRSTQATTVELRREGA